MTSSRRGFFATLAALPAVVLGRKAVTNAPPPSITDGSEAVTGWAFLEGPPREAREIVINIPAHFGSKDGIARDLLRAYEGR